MKNVSIHPVFLVAVLALSLSSPARGFDPLDDPDLLAWWAFDEGTGNLAADGSGNGNDGTLNGGAEWVPGVHGGALAFNGSDAYVGTEQSLLNDLTAFTMAGWINAREVGLYASLFGQNDLIELGFTSEGAGTLGVWMSGNGWAYFGADYPYPYPSWHHVALAGDATRIALYIDGQEEASDEAGMTSGTSNFLFSIGGYVFNENVTPFDGEIDDVWVYKRALTQEEIQVLMAGAVSSGLAADPSPADEATGVPLDTALTWTPGELADMHDVYFGATFDEVNEADITSAGVYRGRQAGASFKGDVLDWGRTYFWRIDEVNAPPDSGVLRGDVWNFTAETYVYPVSNIVATASSSADGADPANTINGSGLDADDLHSMDDADMWQTALGGHQSAWIQYEFDQVYKLTEMWVWNYNAKFESWIGIGFKDVTIEYSVDGVEWTVLGKQEFTKGPGADGYAHDTVIDLQGVMARYIRLTADGPWGTTIPQAGLSEVRFYHLPVHAREPQPGPGATGVGVDPVLSWRPGREAAAHEVYFGTDKDAVVDGTAFVDSTTQASYAPGALDYGQLYHWKIVEVNDAETPAAWESDIWEFQTAEYMVAEDFESYTNNSPDRVFQTWIDGWGFSADDFYPDGNPGNGTGASAGHDIWTPGTPHYEGSIMETVVVNNGRQALPMYYDNTAAPFYSEVERTFTPAQNWQAHGLKTMSLFFRGQAGNTGQLYIKINGTRVPYDGGSADIARTVWQPWNIDLSTVEGNLTSVTSLAIGVEDGAGRLYIDDIRIYPRELEFVTPVQPSDNGLAAYYALEGNANDSSGHNYHGVEDGQVGYGPGVEGQAIILDGIGARVMIEGVGITGAAPRTISGWVRADTVDIAEWTGVFGFTGAGVDGQHFDIEVVGNTNSTTLGYYGIHLRGDEYDIMPVDEQWRHVAAAYDGATLTVFGDGLLVNAVPLPDGFLDNPGALQIGKRQDFGDYFPGQVDEVRIYDRALTVEEVAWLAGRRSPMHKPF
jgi:hypothetical protein